MKEVQNCRKKKKVTEISNEEKEIEILIKYLPEQLSEDEIIEKRLQWAKNTIKDIKRIEARYYSEKN